MRGGKVSDRDRRDRALHARRAAAGQRRGVEADVVVTATGLNMKLLGGIALGVDGEPVSSPERFIYKGMMLSGVPNLFLVFGYANASWTLRSDLTARSVCRLLKHMAASGFATCRPARATARSSGGR